MAFAVARRYPSVLRRLVLAKRIPSVRRNVSFIASGLNRGVPSGTPRIAQLLPIRLKNCYATAAKSSEKKKASTKKRTTKKTTGAKAKKAVAKKKDGRGRKPLTEEQKEEAARKKLKRRIKMLKEAALTPPKTLPSRPHRIAFPGGPLAKGDNYYSRLSDAEKAVSIPFFASASFINYICDTDRYQRNFQNRLKPTRKQTRLLMINGSNLIRHSTSRTPIRRARHSVA